MRWSASFPRRVLAAGGTARGQPREGPTEGAKRTREEVGEV